MILGGLGLIVAGLCTSVADAPSALARPLVEGVSSLEHAFLSFRGGAPVTYVWQP